MNQINLPSGDQLMADPPSFRSFSITRRRVPVAHGFDDTARVHQVGSVLRDIWLALKAPGSS